jgi:hypothetical protein
MTNVARYVALFAAPLLFVGFAPPAWVRRRFSRPMTDGAPFDRKVRGAA